MCSIPSRSLGRGYPREQTSEQLPAQVGEGLHSSDGEAAWKDHHGRVAAAAGRNWNSRFGTSSGDSSERRPGAEVLRQFDGSVPR